MDVTAQRLLAHGCVQGVGYRDAAVQAAFEAGISGWVRNCRDGTVELHAQGPRDAVERFAGWCRRGPPLARVTGVDEFPADVDASLRYFERRATG